MAVTRATTQLPWRAGLPAHMARLLVLRALGLGDLLTVVPALRELRRSFPSYRIVLAAPAELRPLIRLIGAVDEVLPTPSGASWGVPAAPSTVGPVPWTGRSPIVAVNLHGRGPQSHRALLALGPSRLMAFAHPQLPDVDGPEWDASEHEVARWCRLLRHYGMHPNPHELSLHRPDRISPVPDAIVIHPGAGSAERRWPPERFAAVGRRLRACGELVVVTGSKAERPLAEYVAEECDLPHQAVLAGETDVDDLAAIVADARLVVCGDTGVGHLATAYATPSVLVFGRTPPSQWGPPGGRARHVALYRDDGGPLAITVEAALDAAHNALAATAPLAGGVAVGPLAREEGTAA